MRILSEKQYLRRDGTVTAPLEPSVLFADGYLTDPDSGVEYNTRYGGKLFPVTPSPFDLVREI